MNSIRTLAFVTKSLNRMDSQLSGWPTPAATLHAMVSLVVLSVVLAALAGLAQAQPFRVFHSVSGNGTDGAYPYSVGWFRMPAATCMV